MSNHIHGIPAPAFRLPAESTIGRVQLQVADLGRSLDYYSRVLGLRILAEAQGGAVLGPHGSETVLVELIEHPGAVPVPRTGRLGLYHFAILLPSRAALGAFVTHLASLNVRAGMANHAVSEAIYLTDPDGLGIEVYADRPRSEWRYEGQQLYMTTEQLDVASLAAAAREAGVSWQGMPAGTVMGHIHLHVGDLDRASGLYHAQLGLDQTVWGYPGALFMSAGGYHHHLAVNTWAARAPVAAPGDAQLLEWEMILPKQEDVEAVAASVQAGETKVIRDGGAVIVLDPWGIRVSITHHASTPLQPSAPPHPRRVPPDPRPETADTQTPRP